MKVDAGPPSFDAALHMGHGVAEGGIRVIRRPWKLASPAASEERATRICVTGVTNLVTILALYTRVWAAR